MQGRWLHIDCFSGIAGDMTLAALIDLGVPKSVVTEALAAVGLGDVELTFAAVTRSSLAGLHLRARRGAEIITPVEAEHDHAHDHDHAPHHHRHYTEIRDRIAAAALPASTQALALSIFARLAAVEAARHGVPVEAVTFHEVGALDSILDVVGCAAALAWLAPARVTVRTVPVGHGHVHTAHGLLPIPAPATLALLAGFPIEDGGVAMELTTPTGAAILAAVATPHLGVPSGTLRTIGWGAGTRDLPGRPNLLRLMLLDLEGPASATDGLWQLETNLDDLSPQLCAPLVEALLAAGAKDAWLTPVVMKKGRPGFVVGALVEEAHRAAVETALFRNSTTLGLRRWPITRHELARRHQTLATPYGEVRVKIGADGDAVRNASLEYEDVARLAGQHGLTVKELYQQLETLLGPVRDPVRGS